MSRMRQEHPGVSVRSLCELFGVSRSWHYDKPGVAEKAERDVQIRDAIERVVLEFPGYGYRRVTAQLHL
jgi:putative transposase